MLRLNAKILPISFFFPLTLSFFFRISTQFHPPFTTNCLMHSSCIVNQNRNLLTIKTKDCPGLPIFLTLQGHIRARAQQKVQIRRDGRVVTGF
ncbi:hypothetical protein B9Z19DRAFT_1097497 [Tuber borchii]|uniref:Uncharacterized protein n=1 Tax=Tuber borchii TaxID=42251 RepID=A0A2T6ZA02_TUBBO|nr:hypothetical protein B9Z19DRAFT_1097497 [Tuber borchii]